MSAAKKSGLTAPWGRGCAKIYDWDYFPTAVVETEEKVIRNCEQSVREVSAHKNIFDRCGVRAQATRGFIGKTHLATERCPLEPPRWLQWSGSDDAMGAANPRM